MTPLSAALLLAFASAASAGGSRETTAPPLDLRLPAGAETAPLGASAWVAPSALSLPAASAHAALPALAPAAASASAAAQAADHGAPKAQASAGAAPAAAAPMAAALQASGREDSGASGSASGERGAESWSGAFDGAAAHAPADEDLGQRFQASVAALKSQDQLVKTGRGGEVVDAYRYADWYLRSRPYAPASKAALFDREFRGGMASVAGRFNVFDAEGRELWHAAHATNDYLGRLVPFEASKEKTAPWKGALAAGFAGLATALTAGWWARRGPAEKNPAARAYLAQARLYEETLADALFDYRALHRAAGLPKSDTVDAGLRRLLDGADEGVREQAARVAARLFHQEVVLAMTTRDVKHVMAAARHMRLLMRGRPAGERRLLLRSAAEFAREKGARGAHILDELDALTR